MLWRSGDLDLTRFFNRLLLCCILGCGGVMGTAGAGLLAAASPPAGSTTGSATLAHPPPAGEAVVNMFNWANYIAPDVLARFTTETGIRVNYDVFDSLETLEGKLAAGHSGYDVIVPTAEPSFARLLRAGALHAFDPARMPHLAGLDPALMARFDGLDPGHRHGAIYLWGTIGLGIRPDLIRKLDPAAPLDSVSLLLNPEHARKLAACGIAIMDSATDVLPLVLHALGEDPNTTDPAATRRAIAALDAIRPYLRAIPPSSSLQDALARGEICLGLTYSGDVAQAALHQPALRYVAPREGTQLWFDMLAIPTDAPHPQAAEALIDFLLRPDNMAAITRAVRYPSAVPAAMASLPEALREDPAVLPPAAVVAHSFVVTRLPPQVTRMRLRLWNRFKAGA